MDAAGYHDVISGRRRGPVAAAARAALATLVPAYRLGLGVDRLRKRPRRLDVPVISVGNLTCGGTGKTPVVAWLTRRMQRQGFTPGLLSRGYKGDGEANDERLVLDALCPGVPHRQSRDRVAAGRELTRACDVLILDDGFQHRRLAREVDIVLIDALRPWGYGHLLPRGLLREPPSALRRADLVVITRVDLISPGERASLERTIGRFTAAPVATGRFAPTSLIGGGGLKVRPRDLGRVRAAAFCGLGNPQGFAATLRQFGLDVPAGRFRTFPDHHRYTPADLNDVGRWATAAGADALVTTRKDRVKIAADRLGGVPLLTVDIRFEPVHRSELFDTILPRPSARAAA